MSQKLFFSIAVLTIIIGLLGLTGLFRFNQPTVVDTSIPTVQVAQLQKPILRGAPLERANIRYLRIKETEAMKVGFAEDVNLNVIPGMIAIKDIPSTEYISQTDFISPDQPGYIEAALEPGKTPYSFRLKSRDFLGSGVSVGDHIDILVLTSDEQNIGESGRGGTIKSFRTLSVSPLLFNVRVLAIESEDKTEVRDNSLPITIELDRDQIAKMVIARRIGVIEVIKSMDESVQSVGLNADTHDVLPNFKSVTEFRGNNKAYN